MTLRRYVTSFVAGAALTVATSVSAADVVIGVSNWSSVQATGHVLKVVIEDKLGLDAEVRSGAIEAIYEAMDSGAMHVFPEMWLPNHAHLYDKFVKERKTLRLNPNPVSSNQAMCVTRATARRTGIVRLADLADPDMAKNFDTDGDGKGEVWIGESGWFAANVEMIRAKSYGYDRTMQLKKMAETSAMAELAAAVAQDRNIVTYCYTPTHVFTQYDLVVLEEPAYDASKWNVLHPNQDPQWLEKSAAPTAWDTASLHICYATRLESLHPAAAKLLSKVKLNADMVSGMIYALVVEKQDPAEFARKWVAENAALVESWLQ